VVSVAAVLVVWRLRRSKRAKLSASPDVPDTSHHVLPQLELPEVASRPSIASPLLSSSSGTRRFSNNTERRISAAPFGRTGSDISTAHSDIVFAEASDAFAGGDISIGSPGVSRTGSMLSPLSRAGSLRSPDLERRRSQMSRYGSLRSPDMERRGSRKFLGAVQDKMMEPSDTPTQTVAEAVRRLELETQHAAKLKPLPPKKPEKATAFGATALPSVAKQSVALEISQPTASGLQVSGSGYPVHTTAGTLGAIEVSASNALGISSVQSESASSQSLDSSETQSGAIWVPNLLAGSLHPNTTPTFDKRMQRVVPDIQIEHDTTTTMSVEHVSLVCVPEQGEGAAPVPFDLAAGTGTPFVQSAASAGQPKALSTVRAEATMPTSPVESPDFSSSDSTSGHVYLC